MKKKSTKRITLEEMYMRIAQMVASRSTCSRLKVGAVLTDYSLQRIISIGYNGNWKDGPNVCDRKEVGNCGDIHAECNALIKPHGPEATVLFLTDSPCEACAKLIVNAGIKKLYYKNEYRNPAGLDLLGMANIEVKKIK